MGGEGLWNKDDEKINRNVFPAVFYTSGWTGYLPYMKLRRTLYKDGNQLSRNILYLYVLACPWGSVPQYTSWLRNPMANPCQSRWMLGDKNMSVNSLLAFILHEKDGGVVPVIVGSERGRYCIAITPQHTVDSNGCWISCIGITWRSCLESLSWSSLESLSWSSLESRSWSSLLKQLSTH